MHINPESRECISELFTYEFHYELGKVPVIELPQLGTGPGRTRRIHKESINAAVVQIVMQELRHTP